jgi:hypothetical protein
MTPSQVCQNLGLCPNSAYCSICKTGSFILLNHIITDYNTSTFGCFFSLTAAFWIVFYVWIFYCSDDICWLFAREQRNRTRHSQSFRTRLWIYPQSQRRSTSLWLVFLSLHLNSHFISLYSLLLIVIKSRLCQISTSPFLESNWFWLRNSTYLRSLNLARRFVCRDSLELTCPKTLDRCGFWEIPSSVQLTISHFIFFKFVMLLIFLTSGAYYTVFDFGNSRLGFATAKN